METDHVPTDQEIFAGAMEEWTGIVAQLWDAFGKEIDKQRLKLYTNNLSDVPLGLLERAVNQVIREHQFNNVPTLGQVWSAIKKELKVDGIFVETTGIDDAIHLWKERQATGMFIATADGWKPL